MVEGRDWLDVGEWAREGRGRSWMFSLPTQEVVVGLNAVAAESGADFQLLECSRIQVDRVSFSVYTAKPLDRLSLEGPWQYFIRDLAVSTEIPAAEPLPGVGWPAFFAVNGLVLLHHPDPASKSKPPQSSLGLTHRVVNKQTGERREHRHYDAIFGAIKREFQARIRKSGDR